MKSTVLLSLVLFSLIVGQIYAVPFNNGVTIRTTGTCTDVQIEQVYQAVVHVDMLGMWDSGEITKLNQGFQNDCKAVMVSKAMMEVAAVMELYKQDPKKPNQQYLIPKTEDTKGILTEKEVSDTFADFDINELLPDDSPNVDNQTIQNSQNVQVEENKLEESKGSQNGEDEFMRLNPAPEMSVPEIEQGIVNVMGTYKDRFLALFTAANKYVAALDADKKEISKLFCQWLDGVGLNKERCKMVLEAYMNSEETNDGTSYMFTRGRAAAGKCDANDEYARSFGYSLIAGITFDPGASAIFYASKEDHRLVTMFIPQGAAPKVAWFIHTPYLLGLYGDGECWHARSKIKTALKDPQYDARDYGFKLPDLKPLSEFDSGYFFDENDREIWRVEMKQRYIQDCQNGFRFKQLTERQRKSHLQKFLTIETDP
mmetsp:Transcript_20100/g.22752  ORF Transcript_20100/g.22752 Transcript_20100/m.22752 type:complete len:427 (+) Transcript_20100:50-1330(+)